MVAWYIVDPITLFPILHVPGMYLTYIAGNSRRFVPQLPLPPSLCGCEPEAGTRAGHRSTSSPSCFHLYQFGPLTLVAVAGNLILSILPDAIIRAPQLPAARIVRRYVYSAHHGGLPLCGYRCSCCACVLRYLNTRGVFKVLPGRRFMPRSFSVS